MRRFTLRRASAPLLLGAGAAAAFLVATLVRDGLHDGWRDVLTDVGEQPVLASSSLVLLMLLAGVAALPAAAPRALRLPPPKSLILRLLQRGPVDRLLDAIRFRVDTFPRRLGLLKLLRIPALDSVTPYQDLPWVGLNHTRRGEASQARWDEMLPLIERLGVRSAVDIGANVGWFCFAFDRAGIPSIAVDSNERNVRVGLYARARAPQRSRVSFMLMDVQPDTVELLPAADAVLFLAVWHHVVKARGLATASALLRGVWDRTDRVLFFETGERELPADWGLPEMAPDPRSWLTDYLGSTCAGGTVLHLGCHHAGIGSARRNLFAIVR